MGEVARDRYGRYVSIKWDDSKIVSNLRSLKQAAPGEIARALYQETQIEATECKRRCPVDTGALRSSIHVEGPAQSGRKIMTLIVCGGQAAPYAIFVHENLSAHHPVGEAKFIESTLLESSPHMADRVAHRISLNRAAGF
jgi:hypothetical protein